MPSNYVFIHKEQLGSICLHSLHLHSSRFSQLSQSSFCSLINLEGATFGLLLCWLAWMQVLFRSCGVILLTTYVHFLSNLRTFQKQMLILMQSCLLHLTSYNHILKVGNIWTAKSGLLLSHLAMFTYDCYYFVSLSYGIKNQGTFRLICVKLTGTLESLTPQSLHGRSVHSPLSNSILFV